MTGDCPVADNPKVYIRGNYTTPRQNLLQYRGMNIAIQGQAGSFHAEVASRWFGNDASLVPCATFADVFETYENGEADAIIAAVENTIYGSINDVYQLVEDCPSPIIGEVKLEIAQQLIGLDGARLSDIREIYSHPVALAQCRSTLRRLCPDAELIEFFDTAGAVEYVASLDAPEVAAVASKHAAALHDMTVIEPNVHDAEHNYTRFLVLADQPTPPDANRSSLVITTSHKPGALVEVLQVFAAENVNLAKLQSQPIVGQPWNYKFFVVVDCAGEQLRKLVSIIEQSNHTVTLLGEYVAD